MSLQGVCNPVSVSIFANTTNTVTSSTNILSQVAELKLVDTNKENEASTPVNVENFQLHGEGVTELTNPTAEGANANAVYPIQVLTTPSITPQLYILLMTMEDSTSDPALKDEIKQSFLILDENLNLQSDGQMQRLQDADANMLISKLKEPQRTSTPTFDENGLGSLNDTIVGGYLQTIQTPKEAGAVNGHVNSGAKDLYQE